LKASIQYLKQAQEFSLAQYSLHVYFKEGLGTEPDEKISWEYCKRAASQWHYQAKSSLGLHYLEQSKEGSDGSIPAQTKIYPISKNWIKTDQYPVIF